MRPYAPTSSVTHFDQILRSSTRCEAAVATGDANVAIVSLLIFIVAGAAVVLAVNLPRGMEQAKAG